jgi:hypothetical protein
MDNVTIRRRVQKARDDYFYAKISENPRGREIRYVMKKLLSQNT